MDSSSWQVRESTSADADSVGMVYALAWRAAFGAILTPGLVSDEELRSRGASLVTASLSLVAHKDGTVAAIAASSFENGQLDVLYVDPFAWGTGAADLLMQEVERRLTQAGTTPWLWVWEGNARAVSFYQGRGWKPDGGSTEKQFGPHLFRYVRLVLNAA